MVVSQSVNIFSFQSGTTGDANDERDYGDYRFREYRVWSPLPKGKILTVADEPSIIERFTIFRDPHARLLDLSPFELYVFLTS